MDLRVAAYGVIVREGRVLLAHWSWPEAGIAAWTLPGGGLEPGEDPADAAVREIREETGYAARLEGLLGISSRVIPADERVSRPGVPQHNLRVIYAASVVGGELTHERDGSTDEARWFPLDEVAALGAVGLVAEGLTLWHEHRANEQGDRWFADGDPHDRAQGDRDAGDLGADDLGAGDL